MFLRSIVLLAGFVCLLLPMKLSSQAMALGQFGLPSGFLPMPRPLVLVAQQKKKMSAREACVYVYHEDPVRAYFKQDGKGLVCYYYSNIFGSIHDRRFGDPEKKNFNQKKN